MRWAELYSFARSKGMGYSARIITMCGLRRWRMSRALQLLSMDGSAFLPLERQTAWVDVVVLDPKTDGTYRSHEQPHRHSSKNSGTIATFCAMTVCPTAITSSS